MIKKAINRLSFLCSSVPQLLNEIDEQALSFKPGPGKWSKKQIIGHLIDSATNNHHRFVRGQFEEIPLIKYDQDKWNERGYYSQMDSKQLISFWTAYNRQLLELIQHIPEDKLSREVITGAETKHSIEFLINDYVDHLEHHLRQLVEY